MNQEVDTAAQKIWDYLKLNHSLVPADLILVLCSNDTRVAVYAAELHLTGFAPKIAFSGGLGRLTEGVWERPEAEIFADEAIKLGVEQSNIIIENKSTNTGENIEFTYRKLKQLGTLPEKLILVQKPYMTRRAWAAIKKQYPDKNVEIMVTSPPINYADYFSETLPKTKIINVMVGDLQRIKTYAAKGYQIKQEIPEEVWQAYKKLVNLGFNKDLVNPSP